MCMWSVAERRGARSGEERRASASLYSQQNRFYSLRYTHVLGVAYIKAKKDEPVEPQVNAPTNHTRGRERER